MSTSRFNPLDPLGLLAKARRDLDRLVHPSGGAPGGYSAPVAIPPRQRTHDPSAHSPYTCQELANLRSLRSGVMTRAWDHVRQIEDRGGAVSNADFGSILEREWEQARQATRRCEASPLREQDI